MIPVLDLNAPQTPTWKIKHFSETAAYVANSTFVQSLFYWLKSVQRCFYHIA